MGFKVWANKIRHENVFWNLVVASYIKKSIELGFRQQLEKEGEEEQEQQPWFSSRSNLFVLS